jgi:hypothetical protein
VEWDEAEKRLIQGVLYHFLSFAATTRSLSLALCTLSLSIRFCMRSNHSARALMRGDGGIKLRGVRVCVHIRDDRWIWARFLGGITWGVLAQRTRQY